MRMRRKPWARPELEACAFNVKDPCSNRGKWHEQFVRKQPLHIELGCGKGTFISVLAPKNPHINYLALDIKSEMLGLTKRNIEKTYNEAGLAVDNVLIMSQDIERILDMMDENDVVDRIYINFCNPWPKPKSKKKRLTHSRQLEKYKVFLKDGGEVFFKTDDDGLFEESIEYFKECGFEIAQISYDLHNSEFNEGNIRTEHEEMFSREGIKIKYLKAVLL